jgi:hypothetical protein
MKIKNGAQVEIQDINYIDLFFIANNFEERKLTAFNSLKNIKYKIALKYSDSKENDINNFEIYTINNDITISNIISDKIDLIKEKEITIVIDYSCMTKSWYFEFISFFNKLDKDKEITVYYLYTPSQYSEPKPTNIIKEYYPIYKSFLPNSKPKLLIVCLGYEQNKAQGIIDYLDPAKTFIFYTKPAIEDKFVLKVEESNKDIIELYNTNDYLITFPFDNLLYLERRLKLLINQYKNDYNIIIAPLGPKPFTLVSIILSTIFNEIEIWRVSTNLEKEPFESKPIEDKFIINKVVYENI